MADTSKPVGEQAGWTLKETSPVFKNNALTLRRDTLDVKGLPTQYAYVERAEAVIIVPVTEDGKIIMIRQYRYTVDDWCLEVPAGGTHDTGNMPLEEVARKELSEEIGATTDNLEYISFFYSCNAVTDEKCHVYLATGVKCDGDTDTEHTESIEVHTVTASEAIELAKTGQVKTGPAALALLLCEPRLSQLGIL